MSLYCHACGESNADCGCFLRRGDTVVHIGACCQDLIRDVSGANDPESVTHKYAT